MQKSLFAFKLRKSGQHALLLFIFANYVLLFAHMLLLVYIFVEAEVESEK